LLSREFAAASVASFAAGYRQASDRDGGTVVDDDASGVLPIVRTVERGRAKAVVALTDDGQALADARVAVAGALDLQRVSRRGGIDGFLECSEAPTCTCHQALGLRCLRGKYGRGGS